MSVTHDPSTYTTIPPRTTAGTLSLARALLGAAPQVINPAVGKRLGRIHEKARALQSVWIAINRPEHNGGNARECDLTLDRVWAAVRSRLVNWIDMGKASDEDEDDELDRATRLNSLLFPTGLDFLRLPYVEQWAESERRIALMSIDKLGNDLDDLVDPRVVKRLLVAHEAYGRVLGITERQANVDPGRVIDALRELRAEMVGFTHLVLGLVDEADAASVAAAQAQLEPILRYRRPRGGTEGEVDVSSKETEADSEPIEMPLPDAPQLAPAV
jgi:hypothetical protein